MTKYLILYDVDRYYIDDADNIEGLLLKFYDYCGTCGSITRKMFETCINAFKSDREKIDFWNVVTQYNEISAIYSGLEQV